MTYDQVRNSSRALCVSIALAGCQADATETREGIGHCGNLFTNDRYLNVFGGMSSSADFDVDERVLDAIVAIEVLLVNGDTGLCSGVIVGEHELLTAKHCIEQACWGGTSCSAGAVPPAVTSRLVLQRPCTSESPEAVWLHPVLDVALLRKAEWASGSGAHISLLSDNLDTTWIGNFAFLLGFGQTEIGDWGQLRIARERIVAVEEQHIVVDGQGASGACVGDSGGPLLGRGSDGTLRVLGILDDGDPSCTGKDRYTRGDLIAKWSEWDDESILAPEANAEAPQCDGMDEDGECNRGIAMWCVNGVPKVRDCGAIDSVCVESDGRPADCTNR